MTAVLFDLDQTLVDSSSALDLRTRRVWPQVYAKIPGFVVYEGVAAMLAMLTERQVPMCIVTSSPRTYCVRVREHHGLRIEKTVCFHDTMRRKPHPDPILKGIKLLGVAAGDVWAVGDDAKDVVAAHAAGAHSVAVTWGSADVESLKAAGAERLFDTVAELHQFLDGLTQPAA